MKEFTKTVYFFFHKALHVFWKFIRKHAWTKKVKFFAVFREAEQLIILCDYMRENDPQAWENNAFVREIYAQTVEMLRQRDEAKNEGYY